MFMHVHHPDSAECGGMTALQHEIGLLRPLAPSLPCHIVVAMLVRDPFAFYVSWWYYVGARRCDNCAFSRYLQLNPNAQSHLAVGGKARQYSEALLARHAARDPALRTTLRDMLRSVDVLGTTESLEAFVFVLCERAGLRVCPRPGISNARNPRSAREVERAVSRGTAAAMHS